MRQQPEKPNLVYGAPHWKLTSLFKSADAYHQQIINLIDTIKPHVEKINNNAITSGNEEPRQADKDQFVELLKSILLS